MGWFYRVVLFVAILFGYNIAANAQTVEFADNHFNDLDTFAVDKNAEITAGDTLQLAENPDQLSHPFFNTIHLITGAGWAVRHFPAPGVCKMEVIRLVR